MALEWSQKSRTIWIRPCWAAAPGKARGEVVAEQPLAGEAEHGVVLRRRPGEIAAFEGALHGGVLPFDRPNPEPGQDDVHRQIGHARGAQERLRLLEPGGAEGAMPGPEVVRLNLQRSPAANRPGPNRALRGRTTVPASTARSSVHRPARGEGEAALGVIGGPRAVEAPERSWAGGSRRIRRARATTGPRRGGHNGRRRSARGSIPPAAGR